MVGNRSPNNSEHGYVSDPTAVRVFDQRFRVKKAFYQISRHKISSAITLSLPQIRHVTDLPCRQIQLPAALRDVFWEQSKEWKFVAKTYQIAKIRGVARISEGGSNYSRLRMGHAERAHRVVLGCWVDGYHKVTVFSFRELLSMFSNNSISIERLFLIV